MGPTTPSQPRENPWEGHGPANVLQPGERDSILIIPTLLQGHSAFSSMELLVLDNSALVPLNSFLVLNLNPGPKFSCSSRHQQQIEQNSPNSFKLKHALRYSFFFKADILYSDILIYYSFISFFLKLIFCLTGSYQRAPRALPRSPCFTASSAVCRDQHQLLC